MTRLTNAYSKKKRNLDAAVSLHVFWYNWGRIHGSLRTTPAMVVGLCNHVWTLEEMISEALAEAAKLPAPRASVPPSTSPQEPAQLELPFHLHAGGPKGPQLNLF